MTSDIDDPDFEDLDDSHASQKLDDKKTRLQGACDYCRRKKVKCERTSFNYQTSFILSVGDRAKMPAHMCSNCTFLQIECVHTPRVKKRASQSEYIRGLERRLAVMESLLQNSQVNAFSQRVGLDKLPEATTSTFSPFPGVNYPIARLSKEATSTYPEDPVSETDDDLAHEELAEHIKAMSLSAIDDRFYGPSSGFMLAKEVVSVKVEKTGDDSYPTTRPEVWKFRPWELSYALDEHKQYMYPPSDLLSLVVGAYFQHVNLFYPLLHRPSFEASISLGLHLRDRGFGTVVLAVCALGSRFLTDPRVHLEMAPNASPGWKYISQVPPVPRGFMTITTLYDMQYYCLAMIYYHGTSMPHIGWNLAGFGLRCIQERGFHRRKSKNHKPTAEGELWKRTFWCLISMDRMVGSYLGRSLMLHSEDFDVDPPIECDDEYWENGFVQPEGKPSHLSFFVYHIKLCEILAFATRTLYASKKSRVLTGIDGEQWEQRIVTEMDSALNQWLTSLPEHIRWEVKPPKSSLSFASQAAALYKVFYFVQIQIHRPFLQKISPLSSSSLVICLNAARSLSLIIEIQLSNKLYHFPPLSMASSFTCGLILLLNFWIGKGKSSKDSSRDLKHVQSCMALLRFHEPRWFIAGRFWDILNSVSMLTSTASSLTHSARPTDPTESPSLSSPLNSPPGLPLESFNTMLTNFGNTSFNSLVNQHNNFWNPGDDWNYENLLLPQMSLAGGNQPYTWMTTESQHAVVETTSGEIAYENQNQPYPAAVNLYQGSMSLGHCNATWPKGFNLEQWNEYFTNLH